jgi:hypothetical protein
MSSQATGPAARPPEEPRDSGWDGEGEGAGLELVERDPVIDAFLPGVDRTLLRRNLRLTPAQRAERFLAFAAAVYECRGAANPSLKVWR